MTRNHLLGDPVATLAESPFLQAAALDELVKGGVQIETSTNDMMGAFGRAWDDVAKEKSDRDPGLTGVLNNLEEFRAPSRPQYRRQPRHFGTGRRHSRPCRGRE